MNGKIYALISGAALLTASPTIGQSIEEVPTNSAAPNSEVHTVKRHTGVNGSAKAGGGFLFYEDFQNGLAGNTAFGAWNTSGQDSVIWEHDLDGSTGQFSTAFDTLLSASSSNGWMMFDGDGSNPGPQSGFENREGYLISPVIDLTGSPYVHMEFDHRFRFCCSFEFGLTVAVTTDGFQTMTKYTVSDPWQRNETPPNPVSMRFSITDALDGGDLSNVQFRFEWEGLQVDANGQGTSHYVWMLDDVTLRETLPNDMMITQAEYSDFSGTGELEYTVYSYDQLRPVTFKGWVTNDGVNDMGGVMMTVDAVGANSSFNTASNAISIAALANDTVFGNMTFTPMAVADTFNIMYAVSQDSIDMKPINNDTTGMFTVSENILARDLGDIEMSFTGGADQGQPFELCVAYDITADASLYSVDVVFTPTSNLDIITDAVILDANRDPYEESINEYEITAADTSSFDGPPTYFNMVFQNPVQLLAGETYYACVRHFGGDTLAIGLSGRAKDQTCFVFENNSATWFNMANIPMIRMNFDASIGIEEIVGNIGGLSAQPNPFTDRTTIKFDLVEGDDVTLTLTDVSGRVVSEQHLGKLPKGAHQVQLEGTNMEAGVYFYTLRTPAGSMTEQLVLQR